ncbi:MAG: 4-hydroxy-tetrahydrodipicolinate synthase [Veillonellales bacterium]
MKSFGRVLTAMITPFHEDLTVDYEGAANLARYLVANGSDGLVVAGSTGEAATLTEEERLHLFSTVLDAVGDQAAVIGGTGNNNTASTVQFSRKAAKLGLHGVLVAAPYYNKPTQKGIYQHIAAVADAVDTPIVVYNIPGRTGVNILPETALKLAALPNVKAIKESSGNLEQIAAIIRQKPADVAVYSGDDALTLPILSIGGQGIVSVASHIVGNEIKAMVDAYQAGRVAEARDMHLKLLPIFKVLFITTNPIPVKSAVSLLGLSTDKLRLPLTTAEADEVAKIRQAMLEAGLTIKG